MNAPTQHTPRKPWMPSILTALFLLGLLSALPAAGAIGAGTRCTGISLQQDVAAAGVYVSIDTSGISGHSEPAVDVQSCTDTEQEEGGAIWTWIFSVNVPVLDIIDCGTACDGFSTQATASASEPDQVFHDLLASPTLSFQDYCGASANLDARRETAEAVLAKVHMDSVSVSQASCTDASGHDQPIDVYSFEAVARSSDALVNMPAALNAPDIARAEFTWHCTPSVKEEHWYGDEYQHTMTGSLTLTTYVFQAVIKSDSLKAGVGDGDCSNDNIVHDALGGNAAGTILVAIPVCGQVSVASNEVNGPTVPIIGDTYLTIGFNVHFTGKVGVCDATSSFVGNLAVAPVIGVEGFGDFNLP